MTTRRPFRWSVLVALSLVCASVAFAQKGIDAQTKTIKEEGNKVTTRGNDVSRSFNWGKDKTKVRDRLPNPYRLASRRDILISSIIDALREKKIIVDDASSRLKEGIIVTQPFVFAKGAVITLNELHRTVNAKVEGRAGNGLMSEWVTVRSSGAAEDEFLSKLVELVTGVSPDAKTDTN